MEIFTIVFSQKRSRLILLVRRTEKTPQRHLTVPFLADSGLHKDSADTLDCKKNRKFVLSQKMDVVNTRVGQGVMQQRF